MNTIEKKEAAKCLCIPVIPIFSYTGNSIPLFSVGGYQLPPVLWYHMQDLRKM